MKPLENIFLDFLIGRCNLQYFFDAPPNHTLSMYCLIDKFSGATCENTVMTQNEKDVTVSFLR